MAIEYYDGEVKYEGCVLGSWEHSEMWDSDFYAEVWDEERQEVRDVMYDSTRYSGRGSATVDATKGTIHKVYKYYKNRVRENFDKHANKAQAREVRKGDTVIAIKGRKVKKGTQGKVFWVGTKYNPYSRINERRVGLEIDGERVFTALENVEPVNWQDRLITGRKRKKIIRDRALEYVGGYKSYLAP